MAFAQAIEQALGLLPRQQFVGVLADDFGEVRGEHGGLIDDRIAACQRLRLEGRGDPESGRAEGGFARGRAVQRRGRELGTDGEHRSSNISQRAISTPRREMTYSRGLRRTLSVI